MTTVMTEDAEQEEEESWKKSLTTTRQRGGEKLKEILDRFQACHYKYKFAYTTTAHKYI